MLKRMKRYAIVLGVLGAVALLALWAVSTRTAQAPTSEEIFCAQDVEECADGSFVSRVPPACAFAVCPEVKEPPSTEGILPYTSGIEGTVLLGPTCPVMRDPPDPQCADKPYATVVTVYRTGSKTPFAIGNSDENGAFTFALPPGSYTLMAGGAAERLPRCNETSAAVVPEEYVRADISCDTGIR